MSWWENRRRLRVDSVSKQLLGDDPRTQVGSDALAAQQFRVGVFVRECYDGGFDPISLIQNLMVGAVFVADNHGVSRDQLIKLIPMIELKKERQLVFDPSDDK